MPSYKALSPARALDYLGDAQGVRSLMQTLHSTLTQELPQLARWVQEKDTSAVRQCLHQIKGFAPVFGAESLVQNIMRVEALSKATLGDQDFAPLAQAYQELAPHLQQWQDEAKAYLAQS
ncbi:MAG: Hpt domain-containing protein [Limnohabitans sp.]|jgi:HPt (histidine-containing phosphotransfer) domain-containing protein|nr:Hpt domain-containing protein [Burkholderiales bacterium]